MMKNVVATGVSPVAVDQYSPSADYVIPCAATGETPVATKARSLPIDLFRQAHEKNLKKAQPLAARMRPRTLDEFVGQEHFLGPDKLLRRLLTADRLGSVIFYGPPGSGKTALAHVIAQQTQCVFRQLN